MALPRGGRRRPNNVPAPKAHASKPQDPPSTKSDADQVQNAPSGAISEAEQLLKNAYGMGIASIPSQPHPAPPAPPAASGKDATVKPPPLPPQQDGDYHPHPPALTPQPTAAARKRRRVAKGAEPQEAQGSNEPSSGVDGEDTPVHRSSLGMEGNYTDEHVGKGGSGGEREGEQSEHVDRDTDPRHQEDQHQEQEDGEYSPEEDEPDWEAISQHEPARTDAPVFLAARDRRTAADERFATALDECHAAFKQSVDDLIHTAAEIYNGEREKLDELESELKQDFVANDEARASMQTKLEESATAAQGLFAQLLMRVSSAGAGRR